MQTKNINISEDTQEMSQSRNTAFPILNVCVCVCVCVCLCLCVCVCVCVFMVSHI